MTDSNPNNVWYVSAGPHGFTDNPKHAEIDRFGNPVVASGLQFEKLRAAIAEFHAKINEVWTQMLDQMEEKIKHEASGWPERLEEDVKGAEIDMAMRVLSKALQILHFGEISKENAHEIQAMAMQKYAEESE